MATLDTINGSQSERGNGSVTVDENSVTIPEASEVDDRAVDVSKNIGGTAVNPEFDEFIEGLQGLRKYGLPIHVGARELLEQAYGPGKSARAIIYSAQLSIGTLNEPHRHNARRQLAHLTVILEASTSRLSLKGK